MTTMTMTVTQARGALSEVVDRVLHHGERIVLQRHGKDAVAIVSVEDARLLAELEDRMDVQEAIRRLVGGETPVPYDEARKALGLT